MITFEGIYSSKTKNLKLLRFSNGKSSVDVVVEEKIAEHIARNIELLAVKSNAVEQKQDTASKDA
jgi:hypothetical protein